MTKMNNKNIIRLIKIAELTGKLELPSPKISRIKYKNLIFKDHIFKMLEKNYSEDLIITGSLALKAYGLFNRTVNDIDFVIKEENPNYKSRGRSYECVSMYGCKYTQGIYIDYFLNKDVRYVEVDGYKFQNIYQIIQHKSNIMRTKDISDLTYLFNKLTNI